MFDTLFDDGLNPRFVTHSPVFRDEIDASGRLPAGRLATHISSAVDGFHARSGGSSDAVDVVRDLAIEHLDPVTASGVLRIDVWLESIDDTTCTYGFLCSSDDGNTPYARGERTISRIDGGRLRPSRWSDGFRSRQASILRGLHNYA